MNSVSRKNGNTALYNLPSLYRGMYNRIAAKIGCDPSYVSRVARGERRSNEVAKALQVEIQKTWALALRPVRAKADKASNTWSPR
jgi:hypothetical protein